MQEYNWNPWHGCTKLSPGCLNCYVYRQDEMINKDLWRELYMLLEKDKFNKIRFVKVKGHTGDTFNEMADKVAKEEVEKIK